MKVTVNNNDNRNNITCGDRYMFENILSLRYGALLFLSSDTTNCKLSYIHGIGQIHEANDEDKKIIIDHMLLKAKGCVILNTISEEVAIFIKNTYPTYYYQEVPIGYTNRFQYHICIKNTVVINNNCKDPIITDSINTNMKTNIKTKLLNILKTKKRKADYVEEFINNL